MVNIDHIACLTGAMIVVPFPETLGSEAFAGAGVRRTPHRSERLDCTRFAIEKR